jgi:2-keto-4-pentenoate hydratase/2-oxohepta-3-ene-1,7-dioic acid hydratase in catechol pathway
VIDGFTCANDLTAREVQLGDRRWFRGTGFDGFCPVGPRVVPLGDLDPADLRDPAPVRSGGAPPGVIGRGL